ncbi:GTPase IMAP family member 4 isoform X2 [Silurus meridionalis]|uniref:GTPase IMAP family member 4 isoform X2 n=1 Tax=Silurus meridionalis TaxID=175797 RepID=UPI001EEBA761|nr:GTPase IMAP family member 4 isoform X2 [Silurus meridionalis]
MKMRSFPTNAGDQHLSTLALVLLGRKNSGKSSAGNTFFGQRTFEAGEKTRQCVKRHGWVDGVRLTVVDTPGWSSYGLANATLVKQELLRSVRLWLPKPQIFLLVIPVDSFSKRDHKAVMEHISLLGSVWNHTVVLFTWADELRGVSIKEHVKKRGKHLQEILEMCGHRYHILNNKIREEHQVRELLETVREMFLTRDR